MTWTRLDDGFWRNPKLDGASDAAVSLYVRALSFACDQLTDGKLTGGNLRMLGAKPAAIKELVTRGLWDNSAGAVIIHDFLEYNESRDEVMAKRTAAASRMRDRRSVNVQANKPRTDRARSREVTPFVQRPRPDPTRDPDPVPDQIPPNPPSRGELRSAAMRAKNGSNRKRDQTALRETQTLDEFYLGKRSPR